MGRKHQKYVPKTGHKKAQQQEYHEADPPEVIIADGLRFQELMAHSRENLNLNEDRCYVISSKWLTAWKDYTGYDMLVKGEDPTKHKNFRKKRPGKLNTDLQCHTENGKYFTVPEEMPEYEFLNFYFDSDLQKDKDYIVVDSAVFTFLHEKYGGNIVQRPLRKVKGGNAYPDVDLHYCSFAFVGPNQAERIKSASESELKKKLDDIIPVKRLQISILWKLEQLKEFLSQYVRTVYGVDRSPAKLSVFRFENYLSLKESKDELVTAFRSEEFYISGRELTEEEVGSYDVDDYIKTSAVLFVDVCGCDFGRFNLPEKIDGHCEECLESKPLDCRCLCNRVFYCSQKCLYDDKPYHHRTCNQAYDSDDDEELLHMKTDATSRCGLDNLGNTCYMNSTLQCLANIPRFASFFSTNEYIEQLQPKEVEENNAIFPKKFAKHLKRMCRTQNGQSFSPWSIKGQISWFIKIFKGYDQHDANDLTVYLLNTLNEFIKKPENSNYAQFLADTFLGEFNSVVSCPECDKISITKDPFLEVSVPIRTHTPVDELSYCLVDRWNHYTKGVCKIQETWDEIFKVIGIQDNPSLRKMVGTLRQLEDETPKDYHKKFRKDVLTLFPNGNSAQGADIPITMYTLRILGGNETKSAIGQQLYLRVPHGDDVSSLYSHLLKLFEVQPEVQTQFNEYLETCQKELAALLESFEQKASEQTKEEEPTEEKSPKKPLTKKQEEERQKARQKAICDFEAAKNAEFHSTFDPLLKFKVAIRCFRKSKRNCEYCNKKCNGCALPLLASGTVADFIGRVEDLKLDVIFTENQPMHEEQRPSPFCQFTTLEECLADFSVPEQLDEENAWYCDACDNMRLANKQLSIEQYPLVLMIQLKRFKQHNGKKIKNNEVVQYPQLLTIGDVHYKFNSAVVHEGSLEGGHYWAVCEKNGRYYTFNDDHVKESEYFHRNAYLLFYTQL